MLLLKKGSDVDSIYHNIEDLILPLYDLGGDLLEVGLLNKEPAPNSLSILRLDCIHSIVSGNKLFKLLPFFDYAESLECQTLVSFGGRFSNHLHAMAYLGHCLGFSTVGFVLGYESQSSTPMLDDVLAWGMQVEFIGHSEYAMRDQAKLWQTRLENYPDSLLIPEGGSYFIDDKLKNADFYCRYKKRASQALCDLISRSLTSHHCIADFISSPVGSAGFLELLAPLQYLDNIALKNKGLGLKAILAANDLDAIENKLMKSINDYPKLELIDGYHCGGFAKINSELVELICTVFKKSGILLDPIYNAKQVAAITGCLNDGMWQGSSIVMLHTGGIQGIRGLYDKMQRLHVNPLPFNNIFIKEGSDVR